MCVAVTPSVFVSYLSRWVFVLTAPCTNCHNCGCVGHMTLWQDQLLLKNVCGILIDFHTRSLCDNGFLFLHNRISRANFTELTSTEVKRLDLLPPPWQRTRGERSPIQRCVVASFIQWWGWGLDEQTDRRETRSACIQAAQRSQNTDVCAQKGCKTQDGVHEHLREQTDVREGE